MSTKKPTESRDHEPKHMKHENMKREITREGVWGREGRRGGQERAVKQRRASGGPREVHGRRSVVPSRAREEGEGSAGTSSFAPQRERARRREDRCGSHLRERERLWGWTQHYPK